MSPYSEHVVSAGPNLTRRTTLAALLGATLSSHEAFGVLPTRGNLRSLLIGIDAYPKLGKLTRAAADATALAKWIAPMGYTDPPLLNPSSAQMLDRLERLSNELTEDTTVVFSFGGHGVQFEGINFLLGAEADPVSVDALLGRGIQLPNVLETLSRN